MSFLFPVAPFALLAGSCRDGSSPRSIGWRKPLLGTGLAPFAQVPNLISLKGA